MYIELNWTELCNGVGCGVTRVDVENSVLYDLITCYEYSQVKYTY